MFQAVKLRNRSTPGGFNGDGATFAKIKFSDDSALTQIENNNVWTPLPSDGGNGSGFVIWRLQWIWYCDENGNSLVRNKERLFNVD